MTTPPVDPLLALGVVGVAWVALASADLFRAVILFIVFGLLMALTWVRLEAPDIALAEAAIGAGLTGAILLDAVGQLTRERKGAHAGLDAPDEGSPATRADGGRGGVGTPARATAAAFTLLLFALLLHTVSRLPAGPGGLTRASADVLAESGVSNPVTAVLLNFRSYDTWLELVVLLVAAAGILHLRGRVELAASPAPFPRDPMLRGMARTLLPIMVLVGGYLIWKGTHAPGGAFQGGAILGSMGVLLLLAGYRPFGRLRGIRLRGGLLAGVAAILVAAVFLLAFGHGFLEIPGEHAGRIILAVEVAVTLAIGLTLAVLFAGPRMPRAGRETNAAAGPARRDERAP